MTRLQKQVLRLLANNRTSESYLAGGTVIHFSEKSPRFSRDVDYFHDIEESVARSAEIDGECLLLEGFSVEWLLRHPSFQRALVSKAEETMRIEWAFDTAFRFFPVERDDDCGFRLHMADAASNKVLALAGRTEPRDFVDIIHLCGTYLSLGALVWAACGKDPGYTPDLLLDQLNRHASYRNEDMARLDLTRPVDVCDLKRIWLSEMEQAKTLIEALPGEELGCLYLKDDRTPVTPDPTSDAFVSLKRHYGSIGGAWPKVAPYPKNPQ